MALLPRPKYREGIKKRMTAEFGGYAHRTAARDGMIWDMKNISCDEYPVLTPRQKRIQVFSMAKPNGFYAGDGIYWVDGTEFFKDGLHKNPENPLSDSKKDIYALGPWLVIMPDKMCYNRKTGDFLSIEEKCTCKVKFTNGTYGGVSTENNTIVRQSGEFAFKAGDAVEISGDEVDEANKKTAVIREVSDDKNELRFYEHTFVKNETFKDATIERLMPDMDFLCENENRLWGCKDDTIYASKLGDIFNWHVYDGVSTASFATDVGSPGEFTGCTSYLGYPVFFKEDNIYKVHGNKPSNFQVIASASLGIAAGSEHSTAVAGEKLFYFSRAGVVQYSGGVPKNISAPFGNVQYKNAVGGSDGTKYYISMQEEGGNYVLFVFDTKTNLWCREDNTQVLRFGWNEQLYFLDAEGDMWAGGNPRNKQGEEEREIESMVEFADFYEGGAENSITAKILMRMEAEAGAEIEIQFQYDSIGAWKTAAKLTPHKKRSYYLPLIPRRCDHFRIRVIGKGSWKIYSLVRESYKGSALSGGNL